MCSGLLISTLNFGIFDKVYFRQFAKFLTKLYDIVFVIHVEGPQSYTQTLKKKILARACGVPAVGVRPVDDVVATIIISLFFFPVATFSHRRSAQINKPIL